MRNYHYFGAAIIKLTLKKPKILLLTFLFSNFYFLLAQKAVNTSFFDKNGALSTIEDALYFRETTDSVDYYKSYYLIDSSLFFYGKIISAKDSSDQKNLYSGLCIWYYSNGNKKTENNYNDKGIFNGTCSDYFENGMLKKQVEYINGRLKNKTFTEYSSSGADATVFQDDFYDNRFNWLLTSNDNGSAKIKIGGLELISKTKKGFIKLFPNKIATKNYSIETIINSNSLSKITKGGIIFGFKDSANYYYYFISKNQYYIGSFKDNVETKHADGFVSPLLIDGNWNKLKVIRLKNKLLYSINDDILFSVDESNDVENGIGLSINTSGIVVFDRLIVREYQNDKVIESTYPILKGFNTYNIHNDDYGIQNFSTGLILNKEGLIITNASNFNQYTQIIVETYVNDSIKKFFADLVVKDHFNNLAIIKIRNPENYYLSEPAYSFCEKGSVEIESDLYSMYFTKGDTNENKTTLIKGKLKTKARFENLSATFYSSLKTEIITLGGPVFTEDGELLGIITVPALKNLTTAVKLGQIEQIIFNSRRNFKKLKKPEKNSISAISRNIVLIKVR